MECCKGGMRFAFPLRTYFDLYQQLCIKLVWLYSYVVNLLRLFFGGGMTVVTCYGL
jgi:hypothetical protein